MKTEATAAAICSTVKTMIGVGKLTSAMYGAKITAILHTKLEMPMLVTAKSVGKNCGCAM